MSVQDRDQLGVDTGGIREIWLKESDIILKRLTVSDINKMQNTFKKTIDGVTYRFHNVKTHKPAYLSEVKDQPALMIPDQEKEEAKI